MFSLSRWTCLLSLVVCSLHAGQTIGFTSPDTTIRIHKTRSWVDDGIQNQDGQPARVFSWSTDRRDWAEMGIYTPQGRALPSLPAFKKLRMTLSVWIPEECGASRVAIRLADSEGEVHQFSHTLPSGKSGWQNLVYEADASKPSKSCWGGQKSNKLLDQPMRLSGLATSFGGKGKTGRIGLGSLRLDLLDAETDIRVDTGDPLNLVKPGQPPRLVAKNPTIKAQTTQFEYVLTGPFGKELRRQRVTVELPAGGTATAATLPAPELYGVYHVRWDPKTVNLGSRPQTSYVHMRPAGPTAEADKTFDFGMCDHLERYPQAEQELIVLAAARCGIKLMRGSACWGYVQRRADSWDFTVMDGILDLCDRHGIAYEPIYHGGAPWAVAKDWKPAVEGRPGRGRRPDFDAWRTYIAHFAARYRDRLPYVVVWNEPDLHGFANFPPEDYVKLLKIAYEETKKHAPKIQVKTAGFSGLDAPYPSRSAAPKYMEKVIAQSKGLYDIFCIHLHGDAYRYHRNLQKMATVRQRLGDDTPWASNETGITSIGGTSELNQAEVLIKKFLTAWSHGAIGYSWYNMRMKGRDPEDGEHNYGIITKDFEPKPAYAAYNMLANYFRNAKHVSTTGKDDYSLMLFQDRHGDWLLPYWSWNRNPYNLFVTGINGQAAVVDIFGNETPVSADNGVILLEGNSVPGVLRITGQTSQPIPLGDILLQEEEFVIYPEHAQSFSFSLQNPTTAPLDYDYRFVPQAGLEVIPPNGKVRVEPGQSRDLPVRFTATKEFAGKHVNIDVGVGKQWQARIQKPLTRAIAIPAKAFTSAPQFVLQDKSKVRQLVPFEGSWQHLFWRGAKDLSAKAWLASTDQGLRLKIEVCDDVHRQPFRGHDIFKGDSVQIGLHFPQQSTFWEIGFSGHDDGNANVHIWSGPAGVDLAASAKKIELQASRNPDTNTTTYLAELPLAAFGVKNNSDLRRCRFNYLINDCDDGKTRESYMQQFPGIGGVKTSRRFARICY